MTSLDRINERAKSFGKVTCNWTFTVDSATPRRGIHGVRHQLWMNDAEGAEIARLHLDIIDTLQQAKQKYTQLLKIHEKTIE